MLYLSPKSVKSAIAPTVIFATNRGMCIVRGTDDIVAPRRRMVQIIRIRVKTKSLSIEDDALQALGIQAILR
jgi:RuvB-like protein 1 (pontin 52)